MNAVDAIIDAVLAALSASPALCDPGWIAEDLDIGDIPSDVAACISVRHVGSKPSRAALLGAPVDWQTLIALDCWARRDGRTSTGRASRALHAAAYARLMADATLGGVVFDILEPDLDGESEAHLTRTGACTGVYPILHRTQARSLDA